MVIDVLCIADDQGETLRCESSSASEAKTVTRKQFAVMLQVQPNTVSDMLSRGEVPDPMVHRERLILWSRVLVERWIHSGLTWREWKRRGSRR